VLLSIGMSNATQEWASKGAGAFKGRADVDPAKNSHVVIVDGAISGQDATTWTNLNAATWTTVASRLTSNGVTTNQVQAIWLKNALANESSYGAFPAHAQALQSMHEQAIRNARRLYPNLKLLYLASRTRAYTNGVAGLNPEPYAYETGWSVKWVVQDQITGTNNLNYDANLGPVVAPWAAWGPYIWTDGTRGRSDGFTWSCSDLESDLTHPNTNGVKLVADQLLCFFKTDPTTAPWFLKPTTAPPAVSITASPSNGLAPLTVNFTVSSAVTNFWWTFDDGDYSLSNTPTKTFPVPGRYQVRLAAQDNTGNAALTSVVINVSGPFAVTTTAVTSNDLTVTWQTTGGLSYMVQATDNLTNSYNDISPVITAPGAGEATTNYTDPGAATLPQRFYRVRLVP
jgi:PKD repeat protein